MSRVEEIYCPKCNFHPVTGATMMEGELRNPCDPGCCATLECVQCHTFYKLVKMTDEEAERFQIDPDVQRNPNERKDL